MSHPILGDLPALRADPLAFLSDLSRRDSDVVPLRLPLLRAVLLLDPADIERVLVTDAANFVKPLWLRAASVRRLLGQGMVSTDGAVWRGQRAQAQPAFHPARLPAYGEAMSALVGRRLEGWESGQTRDIAHEMALLTLEIVASPLLGLNADAEMTGAVSAAMDALMACFTTGRNPFGLLPLPPSRREAHAARRLDRLVDGMLRATPAQPPNAPPTLLSQLRAAPSERGGRGLRGQVKTFLAAGHDSSALTLAWTFVLLARHPGADARLAEELSSVLGGRHPCPADLPCLPYTRMVIKETLRLYPPLWMTGRQAVRACEIDGRRVPAGTTVLTSQWAVQRRPQFFRDPDEFRPERWEGEETAGLPRYAYFPFGGGPRACIGTAFALTEAALILASVAHRFRLTLDQAQEVRPWATMTLRPAGAVTMRLEARA